MYMEIYLKLYEFKSKFLEGRYDSSDWNEEFSPNLLVPKRKGMGKSLMTSLHVAIEQGLLKGSKRTGRRQQTSLRSERVTPRLLLDFYLHGHWTKQRT